MQDIVYFESFSKLGLCIVSHYTHTIGDDQLFFPSFYLPMYGLQ
jgi:hypothetical protein